MSHEERLPQVNRTTEPSSTTNEIKSTTETHTEAINEKENSELRDCLVEANEVGSVSNTDAQSESQLGITREHEAKDSLKEKSNITSNSKSDFDVLDDILEQANVRDNETGIDNEPTPADDEDALISSGDSSTSDSSSDDSSDVDDEEDSSDVDDQDNRVSDDDDEGTSGQPIVSKNEVVDENAPTLPEGFVINTSDPIEEVGVVTGVVEKSLIIKGNISGEFRFLKEDSVLCLEDRTPLGYLFEIFGPLAHPLYRVKFNSDKDIQPFLESKGKKVFYVVPKSNFVYTDSLKLLKGSDASNWNDEEIPEDEQEFSDDEKEMASKKSKNKKKRSKKPSEATDGAENVDESTQGRKHQRPRHQKSSTIPPSNRNSTNIYNKQPGSVFGYRSRSQREQPNPNMNGAPVSNFNSFQQGQIPMFTPPPMMASPFGPPPPPPPSFIFPGQAPSFPNPNVQFQNPQQWHHFYQMQQFMMQQMLASQQSSYTQQQNQHGDQNSNGSVKPDEDQDFNPNGTSL